MRRILSYIGFSIVTMVIVYSFSGIGQSFIEKTAYNHLEETYNEEFEIEQIWTSGGDRYLPANKYYVRVHSKELPEVSIRMESQAMFPMLYVDYTDTYLYSKFTYQKNLEKLNINDEEKFYLGKFDDVIIAKEGYSLVLEEYRKTHLNFKEALTKFPDYISLLRDDYFIFDEDNQAHLNEAYERFVKTIETNETISQYFVYIYAKGECVDSISELRLRFASDVREALSYLANYEGIVQKIKLDEPEKIEKAKSSFENFKKFVISENGWEE